MFRKTMFNKMIYSTYPKDSLPSIQDGHFQYIKPFDRKLAKETEEIASKYSFNLGCHRVRGLNYLFCNRFISLEQADLLARQLINWRGKCERKESTFFTSDHMDALIALIQDQQVRQIPIDEVVNNLQLLDSTQARRIANGLTREEAMSNLPFKNKEVEETSNFAPLNASL